MSGLNLTLKTNQKQFSSFFNFKKMQIKVRECTCHEIKGNGFSNGEKWNWILLLVYEENKPKLFYTGKQKQDGNLLKVVI